MEEKVVSLTTSLSLSPQSSPSQSPATKHQTPSKEHFSPQTPPLSVTRLWRLKAQQNLRNQWSKLASYRKEWSSSSFAARSNATDLVNSYLSLRYMKAMELGVLNDMPDIKKKACWKLFTRQESYRGKLLSSYKNMVASVANMHSSSRSMRTFLKSTSSSLTQFSNIQEDKNDNGDEELAYEFVQMLSSELSLKRLLVIEFLSLSSENFQIDPVNWSDEFYPGEFDNLSICDLFSKELCKPIHPKGEGSGSNRIVETAQCQLNEEVLQVYLTTWLAEVYINTHRVEEIFAIVGEEIHHSLS